MKLNTTKKYLEVLQQKHMIYDFQYKTGDFK